MRAARRLFPVGSAQRRVYGVDPEHHARSAAVGGVVDLTAAERRRVAVVEEANLRAALSALRDVPLAENHSNHSGKRVKTSILNELDQDPSLGAGRGGLRHRPDGVGHAAAPAYQPAKVVAAHGDLDDEVSVFVHLLDLHGVRVLDQRPGEELDQLTHGAYEPVASMPLARKSPATVRVGWAPCVIQCRARSSSTTIVDGSVWGL